MGNRLFNNSNMPTSNTTEEISSNNNNSKISSDIKPINTDVFYDGINIDDHSLLTNVHNESCQDNERMCENSCTVNLNRPELLTDFEDMIDSLRENEAKKTLSNIKEFENVLSGFDPNENNNETIIDLDEIYNYLELGSDNDNVNDPGIQNDNDIIFKNLYKESSSQISIDDVSINENFGIPQEVCISKYNIDDNSPKTQSNNRNNVMDNIENTLTTEEHRKYSKEKSEVKFKVVSASDVHSYTQAVCKGDNDYLPKSHDKNFHADDNRENSRKLIKENKNNDASVEVYSENSKNNMDTVKTDASLPNNLLNQSLKVIESESEVILISSDEEMESHIDGDDQNDGYHSSDFEFITEEEANLDGFIVNFRSKDANNSKLKENCIENNNPNDNSQNNEDNINLADLRQGPNLNNYRENYVIPQGEDYLNLFQGPLNPVMPLMDIIIMENKSTRPSPMNVQYEGMGFDNQLIVRRHRPDTSEEEHADEAKENIKMILSLYPDENKRVRKKRRRH